MKVYVVELGMYASSQVVGVYATPDAAMAAYPPSREGKRGNPYSGSRERPGGWYKRTDGAWDNGLDFDEAAQVTEYDVEGMPG